MRSSDDQNLVGALFEDDLPEGCCAIKCEKCTCIFPDKSEVGEPCICPTCKTELFYRSWCSW